MTERQFKKFIKANKTSIQKKVFVELSTALKKRDICLESDIDHWASLKIKGVWIDINIFSDFESKKIFVACHLIAQTPEFSVEGTAHYERDYSISVRVMTIKI